jgi:hypothetical protein
MFVLVSGLLILCSLCVSAHVEYHVVKDTTRGLELISGSPGASVDYVAKGSFEDTVMTIGWGVLNINTNKEYLLEEQYYAAGLIEGFATARRIHEHFTNMNNEFSGALEQKAVQNFFSKQLQWTDEQVLKNSKSSKFWEQVGAIQKQFYGLVDGYALSTKADQAKQLSVLQFQFLSASGDMLDLETAVVNRTRIDWDDLTTEEAENLILSLGRCSALVKVTPDYSELFAAHSVIVFVFV